VNRLLGYTLAVSMVVGVTQWDAWPFTTYTLAASRPRVETPICLIEYWGLDGSGREWRLDPFTWSPVFDSTLQTWFAMRSTELAAEGKTRALAFLLERAEGARRRLAEGRFIGYDRRLGPTLSAPYWWLVPRPAAFAPTPYVGLRVYEACRVPKEMLTHPGSLKRTLKAAYPS